MIHGSGRSAIAMRARSLSTRISHRVGCDWRASTAATSSPPPLGFVRFREQMAAAGAPLTFRMPDATLRIRSGCLVEAAMSGRFADGGIVTASNAQMVGNRSVWWGFIGRENVDGALRAAAGPGLADECDALPAATPGGEKLLPSTARATGPHDLAAAAVLHALAPLSFYIGGGRASAEAALRKTFESCFALADELELPSLALPALGCGVAGIPGAICARAAFGALEAAPLTSVRAIEFVLRDDRCYAAFADAAHERWGRR